MDKYETHEYDVVVVGAGGAGLRAAIEASARGAETALVCKSLLGKAHTVMAEGGIAAALANVESRDNWQVHFRDTMKGGKFLNQWRMAQLHAQEAPERVRELEAMGRRLRSHQGRPHPAAEFRRAHLSAAGPRRRSHRPGDDPHAAGPRRAPGDRRVHGMHDPLDPQRRRSASAGCFGYQRESGRFVVFRAKAVVLATGGIGRCWEITSNSWEYTADGHAMALWAGADLIDMEFVQFHPTGMVWPPSVRAR